MQSIHHQKILRKQETLSDYKDEDHGRCSIRSLKRLLGTQVKVGFILCSLILASIVPGCIEEENKGPDHETDRMMKTFWIVGYELVLISEESAELIVPRPVFSPLLDDLEIIEGDGNFSFVETEHGPAINISFTGSIRFEGRWSSLEAEDKSFVEDITFNLSTFEQLPDDIEPWSPDYPHVPKTRFFWTHLSNGSITWYEINCWVLFGNGLSGYICDHRTNLDPQWNLLYVAWWGAVNY